MIPINKEIFNNYIKIVEEIDKKNEIISIQNEKLIDESRIKYEKEIKKIKAKNVKKQKKHDEFLEETKITLIHAQEDLIELKKLEKEFDKLKTTTMLKVYCSIEIQLTNVCLFPVEFKEYADFIIESIEDFENFKKYFDESWYLVKDFKENKEVFVQKIGKKYGNYSILDIEFLNKKINIKDISKVNLTTNLEYLIEKFKQILREKPKLEAIPVEKSVKLIDYIAIPPMETPEYFGIVNPDNNILNIIKNSWT